MFGAIHEKTAGPSWPSRRIRAILRAAYRDQFGQHRLP
jgi:hypothetical protein